jgi:hypothetical protein
LRDDLLPQLERLASIDHEMGSAERGGVGGREDERLGCRVTARMQIPGGMDELVLVRGDPLVLREPIDR